ncbi:hypothetical protein N9N28_06460 [Rubripirellula amarantea]|nr:hypothetical protein [Rubripirellula amarantea]
MLMTSNLNGKRNLGFSRMAGMHITAHSATALALVIVGMIAGCDSGPNISKVTGKVTRGGEPLSEIRVRFMPDPDKREGGDQPVVGGLMSTGITNAQGEYDLTYASDPSKHGAELGWHKVVLEDLSLENNRDGKIPESRTNIEWVNPAKTPLSFEVTEGEQVIDIELNDLDPQDE